VYGNISRREFSSVTVLTYQQTGPEIAFRRVVSKGHAVKVVAVRQRSMPFDSRLEFVVTMDGLDLPIGVEIIVPMFRTMQSVDGLLDPRYFERAPP
jgi:hypothetical protein